MTPKSFAIAATLVAGMALPFLAGSALAQNTDIIKERQELMKKVGGAAKASGQMLKGETPFDAAKALEVFQTMNASATAFGSKFPDDSKTGGDTEAGPAIWDKPDEFKAKLAKFEADTAAAITAKPASLDEFKMAFGTVSANCKSCHQEFRVDK